MKLTWAWDDHIYGRFHPPGDHTRSYSCIYQSFESAWSNWQKCNKLGAGVSLAKVGRFTFSVKCCFGFKMAITLPSEMSSGSMIRRRSETLFKSVSCQMLMLVVEVSCFTGTLAANTQYSTKLLVSLTVSRNGWVDHLHETFCSFVHEANRYPPIAPMTYVCT